MRSIVERKLEAVGELQDDRPGIRIRIRIGCDRKLRELCQGRIAKSCVDPFAPDRHLQGVRDFEAPQRRYNGAILGDLGKDRIRARRSLVFEKPCERQRGIKH